MQFEPSHIIALGLAAIGFVVWLVRLEGRVNALKEREAKHDSTRDEVIRLQEQVKHLVDSVHELTKALSTRVRRRVAE